MSIDSVYCHANWAQSLGGISYPLLADFHPKGAVADQYGVYLADKGITDRATVIIDADGIVRYAKSVTPAGERDLAELAAQCESIDASYEGNLEPMPAPSGVPDGSELFVKNNCGFSRATLLAVDNLHLRDAIHIRNVSEDTSAMQALEAATGKQQAPVLMTKGAPMAESADIIAHLVRCAAPV